MKELLVIVAIIFILIEGYRLLRGKWIRRMKERGKEAKRERKAVVLKPKSERDCPHCVREKGQKRTEKTEQVVIPWRERKGKGGRKKKISTEGNFCPNERCEYYGIRCERIHALVGYGRHGKQEEIRDYICQACGKKFTERRNTVLYRLKTRSAEVMRILWLSVLGVDASALEEVFGVGENTIRSWISRSGENGRKLHDILMKELEMVHVQLDELWGSLKSGGQEMWVWVAIDVTTKLVPVMQIGGRTQEMAYGVVHELKRRLKETCVPVFSTDGLRHYFYALTAHFGKWGKVEGKKAVWEVLRNFVYGQVIKHQRRKRTVEVERRMAWGEEKEYRERTKKVGQSGKVKIQPA